MAQLDPNRERKKRGYKASVGTALFSIGLLIVAPSGLCTVLLAPSAFTGHSAFASPEDILFFGMIAAVGAALVYAGIRLRRDD